MGSELEITKVEKKQRGLFYLAADFSDGRRWTETNQRSILHRKLDHMQSTALILWDWNWIHVFLPYRRMYMYRYMYVYVIRVYV